MQLTKLSNLRKENVFFQKSKEFKVKNSKLKYQRIKIETKLPYGKKGALVIETPMLFSFGFTERLNQETDQLTGFQFLSVYGKKDSQPNENETSFFEALNKITEICQQHLEEEFGPNMASYLTNFLY